MFDELEELHDELGGQIERAERAYRSLGELKNLSEIILSQPTHEIRHKLEPLREGEDDAEWRERWMRFRDDALLRELSLGVLPDGWHEPSGPDRCYPLWWVMQEAKRRGYQMPERFIDDKPPSYTEAEAWHAAQILVRGHGRSAFADNRNGLCLRRDDMVVMQHTGQFVVPDPLVTGKTPYFIDQLWIVLYPQRRVRLIALEIDGEHHLDLENQQKDRRRDVMLAAMGYEVYHVAGWWCRIDAFRVMCEFMDAAGLTQNAVCRLIGGNLSTPNDYICEHCANRMCRWDDYWLGVSPAGNAVHPYCAAEMREIQNGRE